MKNLLPLIVFAVAWLSGSAAEAPLWLRYPSLSPDGSAIAFCYMGDIFVVPSNGGAARQLTTHSGYEARPAWSPDGKSIAFVSDRDGCMDIYVVDAAGGAPTRVTETTQREHLLGFKDSETLLYYAAERPSVESIQFPSSQFSQVYEVAINGGKPRMVTSLPMEDISICKDGERWLFHDCKGYEDNMRKHHTSNITRDIWLYTPKDGKYTKLTDFNGEDRTPVWAADGNSFYYLSEMDGTFNVYRSPLNPPKGGLSGSGVVQLTKFRNHPVRFLSAGSNGLLCFAWDGEIYTMKEGGEPRKLEVSITIDNTSQRPQKQRRYSGASDMAVSPNGKEVAFIYHGDVYVTSTEYSTTKQITDTPERERNIEFSPDGRSLMYSAERNGVWQVYQSTIVNDKEKSFAYATELKEENLTKSGKTSFQASYSPDGKKIAFLEERTTIKVLDLKSGKTNIARPGEFGYSYTDGDQWFEWSPDSRWLLCNYIGIGGWNNQDVALVPADGKGEIVNLTESGYSDGSAHWVLDGKAMVWETDRSGYRSHGSWGAESDVYIMFFDLEAYEKFRMNKEELVLMEENKSEKEKKKEEKEEEKEKKDSAENKLPKVEPLKLDLENRRDRIARLTINSSHLGDFHLNKKGDKLYYIASFEGGGDLWMHDLKDNSTKIIIKGIGGGGFDTDKDDNLYLLTGGQLKKVDTNGRSTKNIDFDLVFNYKPMEERAYIFDHAWRQVQEKFYDETLRGMDWQMYHDAYARFLQHINNNYDFADMLSELLGELNGSHTGARFYPSNSVMADAVLGVFYDDAYQGDGVKIKEVILRSPLTKLAKEVKAGDVITHIDGTPVKAGQPIQPLLNGKVGKRIRLTINPAKGKAFDVVTKGISQGSENDLLYTRWVERNRHYVDSLSDGRLGYIHIEGMDSESFRTLYSELLGRYRNKEAVIIDTRHNGGGWLHDDVVTLLDGTLSARFVPRGQYIGDEPFNKWTKPTCMLVCEDNYSDAHATPWLYQTRKVGKLIGAPVAGTMTAVWWETQIDNSLVFGIPQVGIKDMNDNYLENQLLMPDIVVFNAPEDVQKGIDKQLERAVEEMLNPSPALPTRGGG